MADKAAAAAGKELNLRIQEALAKNRVLSGLLPICSNCKKIRDDKGYWDQLEKYIQTHSEAQFTHGICPDCAKTLSWLRFKRGKKSLIFT